MVLYLQSLDCYERRGLIMHMDYAKELVERYENDRFLSENADEHIANAIIVEPVVLALIDRVGDEKHRSIVESIREAENSRYKRVTQAQKIALVDFLLEKYGTARAILAAVYGVTENEMFGSVSEAKPKQEVPSDILEKRQHETEKAAMMAEFIGAEPLKGSEKQVAWAETIRAKALKKAPEELAKKLMKIKSAKWWIDRRALHSKQLQDEF